MHIYIYICVYIHICIYIYIYIEGEREREIYNDIVIRAARSPSKEPVSRKQANKHTCALLPPSESSSLFLSLDVCAVSVRCTCASKFCMCGLC